ncbi:NAD(P)H-dependent flavin oxidoreductase [Pseudomonas auratipiscis]|uniref:Nitronate monooxygenase n=1 Tax=Pseudomonas auratipiscis TaxID=3115853 RepID=A0AB35WVA1_9PSED|nr:MULTISPECIES: nitronate monooxygenase [unclassified Pseudomonas]MEE1868357.1 nitronate monooxygenase [Pseudomonas sp. 120P]MEE1959825.1 nitronate monooxygenase [Pseudomonas sp. 119P]
MRSPLFKTPITEMLGIAHPILCGGMGPGVSDADYVAAVVNAGGMGFIVAAGFADPDEFREQLRRCKQLTAGKGFGVNLYLSRQAQGLERMHEQLAIVAEEGVLCVETSGASPEGILPILREAGIKVLHKVAAARYARSAARLGVDAVIVVGNDCGGHPGVYGISSMVQAAQVPNEVSVPVVIGGGIGTGRQLAATLTMGADAVLMGSRMLVAEELWIHRNYKDLLVRSDGTESVIVKTGLRDHHRVYNNQSAKAVAALDAAGASDFEQYRTHVMGSLSTQAYQTGDSALGMLDFGPSVVFADAVKPVEAIFDEILDDAKNALQRLGQLHDAA